MGVSYERDTPVRAPGGRGRGEVEASRAGGTESLYHLYRESATLGENTIDTQFAKSQRARWVLEHLVVGVEAKLKQAADHVDVPVRRREVHPLHHVR